MDSGCSCARNLRLTEGIAKRAIQLGSGGVAVRQSVSESQSVDGAHRKPEVTACAAT